MKFSSCPNCKKEIEITSSNDNKDVTCSGCSQIFSVNATEIISQTCVVKCPNCGDCFFINEKLIGSDCMCQSCQQIFAASKQENTLTHKNCNTCGESILIVAKKCKHCGEFTYKPKTEINLNSSPQEKVTQQSNNSSNFGRIIFAVIFALMIYIFTRASSDDKSNPKERNQHISSPEENRQQNNANEVLRDLKRWNETGKLGH